MYVAVFDAVAGLVSMTGVVWVAFVVVFSIRLVLRFMWLSVQL